MAAYAYSSLNYTSGDTVYSTYLTGIAGENIVGMYVSADGDDNGFIYNDTTGTWIMIGVPGAYSTVPYGPTTGDATSSIIVVGSYKTGDSAADNGFIYNAANGTYTTIDVPGATDTIPHSTYGEYVVGNYDDLTSNPDYAVYPSGGNAFIYDMATQSFQTIVLSPDAISTTAYGIWNGVIAGGVSLPGNGIQISDAYLYDLSSGAYYTYSYKGAVVTHFDGITGGSTPNSYIVTGDYVLVNGQEGAFSATITDFTNVVWRDLSVPATSSSATTITSGNSGYEDKAVGVYVTSGSDLVTGYIATLQSVAAFDASTLVASTAANAAFSSLFDATGTVGANSATYTGTGNVAAASTSTNATLIVTGGTTIAVPDGYQGIFDVNGGDSLDLSQTTTAVSIFLQGDTSLTLGSGNTSVYAAGNDVISAGSGNVTITGGAGSLNFIGGSGSVYASLGSGTSVASGSTGSASTTIYGGSGSANITAGSGTGTSMLVGGSGTTVEWGAGSGATTFVAGTNGTTIMAGQHGSGTETFFTAAGTNATMALNGANDTVIGGSGTSAILGGTGNDLFAFLNGAAGGSETIYNFSAKDSLAFGGYASDPIASEKVTAGSDVITLTDHTTVTIVGWNHTIFS